MCCTMDSYILLLGVHGCTYDHCFRQAEIDSARMNDSHGKASVVPRYTGYRLRGSLIVSADGVKLTDIRNLSLLYR